MTRLSDAANLRARARALSISWLVVFTAALDLGMHSLPCGDQFVKMLCGSAQDATHRASLGVAGTDGIGTICQRDGTVGTQVHDDFHLCPRRRAHGEACDPADTRQ